MNHDITDEVVLGVMFVDVQVLKQRVFRGRKRNDHSRVRVSVTIFEVLCPKLGCVSLRYFWLVVGFSYEKKV